MERERKLNRKMQEKTFIPNSNPDKKPFAGFNSKTVVVAAVVLASVAAFSGFFLAEEEVFTSENIALMEERFEASQPLSYKYVTDSKDFHKALALMPIPEKEKTQIQTDYFDGKIQLMEVVLWDNFQEDGDVIQLSTDTYSVTVPILHEAKVYHIPMPFGSTHVKITGVHDGGGGVTAASTVNGQGLDFPPLKVGESRYIQVL